MAKLFLKYDQAVLKEFTLSQGIVTIGRLPDNAVQIDNLAVSGHHAKIYWDSNQYFIEDNNSLNGTYVNNARVSHQALKDGDSILIGKHTLAFKDESQGERPIHGGIPAEPAGLPVPKLDRTMMLDTKKMKEMLAGMTQHPPANAGSTTVPPAAKPTTASPAAHSDPPPGTHAKTQRFEMPSTMPPIDKIGVLTVVEGKTDQSTYLLTSKMSVIGKSDMASIKLKGWFAPKMAALVSKRDTGYFIAASEKKTKVKVNGEEVAHQKPLAEGDVVEVAGIKMTFGFQE